MLYQIKPWLRPNLPPRAWVGLLTQKSRRCRALGKPFSAHFWPRCLYRPQLRQAEVRGRKGCSLQGSAWASPLTWTAQPRRSPLRGQQRQREPSEISGSQQRPEHPHWDPGTPRGAGGGPGRAGWLGEAGEPRAHPLPPHSSGQRSPRWLWIAASHWLFTKPGAAVFFFSPSGRIISAPFSSHDNLVWLGRVGGYILLHGNTAPPPLNPPLSARLPFYFYFLIFFF